MNTTFNLSHDSKVYDFFAERVSVTDELEIWRVSSRLDQNKFITVSNNRPFLHAQKKFKAFYKWTVIEADFTYRRITDLITNQIEYYIKGLWQPPKKGVQEKKAAAAKLQTKLF